MKNIFSFFVLVTTFSLFVNLISIKYVSAQEKKSISHEDKRLVIPMY